MRARFFRIIFLVVMLVAFASIAVHGFLLREERLRLVDQQVRDAATAILDSQLRDLRLEEIEEVDEFLTEELGESRIGKFFVIRNEKGKVLFESASAKLLPEAEVPRTPQWITIQDEDQYVRVLNLSLPRFHGRSLQVGVVVDQALLSAYPPATSVVLIVAAALVIGLLATYLLNSFLMRPIASLSGFVDQISSEKTAYRELPPLPESVTSFAGRRPDEMSRLLDGLQHLIERINRGYRTSRAWSSQMAHELKTPLAIIEAEVNQGLQEKKLDEKIATSVREELMQASEAVTAFLSWAELEGPVEGSGLYAHRICKTLEDLQRRLSKPFPARLKIETPNDYSVLARAQHLELVLTNLLRNALLYSGENVVVVRTGATFVDIIDQGPGFAPEVLARWGDPFNKGKENTKGHGLGLAFVVSVCRLYQWPLRVLREESETHVRIDFPPEEA